MIDRRLAPLLDPDEHPAPAKASDLVVEPFSPALLVRYNAAWHSRLPHVQRGPWRLAFASHHHFTVFAVASSSVVAGRSKPRPERRRR